MKNVFNHFTGSKAMNIAQGANAIAELVNTIVQQTMSGGGDNVGGSESVTVIDGDVFVNQKVAKMEESNGRGIWDILNDIKAAVFKQHGSKGQAFLDALESLTKKPGSKGRQEALNEEVVSLHLQTNATVMALISELILCTNTAKDQKKNEIDQLRKETDCVSPKIQSAHRALVDIMALEYESSVTDFELAERAKYAIKLLTGQD